MIKYCTHSKEDYVSISLETQITRWCSRCGTIRLSNGTWFSPKTNEHNSKIEDYESVLDSILYDGLSFVEVEKKVEDILGKYDKLLKYNK